MRLRSHSPEVLQADEKIVRVGVEDVGALRRALARSTKGRSRICAHRDSADNLHEMIITLAHGSYIRPHRHLGKCESFHMIEGELDVVIFNESGEISDVVRLGPYGSERCFYYRMTDPLFHTVIVRTETVLFHETTNGPFVREETEFAKWAPEEHSPELVEAYMKTLERTVEAFG